MQKNILIIGCGKSGAEAASKLSESGNLVYIVDKNEENFFLLKKSFSGITITNEINDIQGIKLASGVKIDTLLVVTGDDDLNIYLAILGKSLLNINHVITRMYDENKSFLIEDYKIDVIYPNKLAFNILYSYMEGKNENISN